MAVNVIEVVPMSTFDFTGGGGTHVIKKNVNVRASSQGTLLVRVHDFPTSPSSGSSISVICRISAPSDEQPEVDFLGDAVATATIDDGIEETPALLKVDLDELFGGWLQVEVVGVHGTSGVSCVLSADLAMKA
jgi:hypothetical protein